MQSKKVGNGAIREFVDFGEAIYVANKLINSFPTKLYRETKRTKPKVSLRNHFKISILDS